MYSRYLVPLALLTVLSFVQVPMAVAGQGSDAGAPLQERMSYAEFRKLGLDHLSNEQLKGLNAWLAAHGDCGVSLSAAGSPHSTSEMRSKPTATRYTSRIAGNFTGWSQDTILSLQDGRRWRVTDDEPTSVATMHNPKVTVWKGFFGTWLLSVDGLDATAHVLPAN